MAETQRDTAESMRLGSGIWLFSAAWLLVVGFIVLLRVWAFIPHVWDLGFLTHALAAVARDGLGAPVPFAGWSFLEDHFSPLLLPLAPLARFSWSSYLLVAVQAAAVAVSVPIAWSMAARTASSRRRVWLLTSAYAFSPVLLFAVFFDIHSSVLAAPLLLLAFDGIDRSRPGQILLAGAGAALLREDVAFFVLVLALLFIRQMPRVMATLGGIAGLVLVVGRLVASGRDPATTPPHAEFAYGYIDLTDPLGTAAGAIDALFVRGADGLMLVLAAIVIPWIGFRRFDWKPIVLGAFVAAPFLFSQYVVTKSVSSQYYFALAPVLFWAAVRGGNRKPARPTTDTWRWLPVAGVALGLIGGPLLAGVLAPGSTTAFDVLETAFGDRREIARTHDVLDCVPDRYSVSVGAEFTPHTPHHDLVWQWPQPLDAAVWSLGGNRFVLEPVDAAGRPDAIVFALGSFEPTEFGYEPVATPLGEDLRVFVRRDIDDSGLVDCLGSIS